MVEIELSANAEEDKEQIEDAKKWLEGNKTQLLEAQKEIQKSKFHDKLTASFFMWDSSVKYWDSWMVCEVTEKEIHLIAFGRGDPNEGKTEEFFIGTVTF